MFCDCIAANACYCEHCVAEYEKLGIQLGDEKAMIRFSYQRITDLCREVKELVGPDRYLYLNGLPYYEFSTMDTHAEVECLPSSHWGYDYFWPNASYSRNAQKLRLYMTGRFQAGWGDHGGYKGKVSAFIKNGGKILSSGIGGLKATSELERSTAPARRWSLTGKRPPSRWTNTALYIRERIPPTPLTSTLSICRRP